MSYAQMLRRAVGLGEDQTYDPPPSAYCTKYINQINDLNAQLVQAQRGCDSRLSSCQASAAGTASGMGQRISELTRQLDGANGQIASLTAELDKARAKTCPIPPPCSCKWWIVATVVASTAAVASMVRKNKDKKHASLP